MFPAAPPGSVVTRPLDFVRSVPEQSPGLPDPNPVIGSHLDQHPGAFGTGQPDVGAYFVGVFADTIATALPGAALYLWETTGGENLVPFAGPLVELGFWNGTAFTAYGVPQPASYLGTGVLVWDGGWREITFSAIPLSAFGISPEIALNAVRIEAVDGQAHNQVTAVAVSAVPEPAAAPLIAIGLAGLVWAWRSGTGIRY